MCVSVYPLNCRFPCHGRGRQLGRRERGNKPIPSRPQLEEVCYGVRAAAPKIFRIFVFTKKLIKNWIQLDYALTINPDSLPFLLVLSERGKCDGFWRSFLCKKFSIVDCEQDDLWFRYSTSDLLHRAFVPYFPFLLGHNVKMSKKKVLKPPTREFRTFPTIEQCQKNVMKKWYA